MSPPPPAAPSPGAHGETAAPRARTPVAGYSDAISSTSAAQTPDLEPASVGPFAAPEGSRHQDQHRPGQGPIAHPVSGPQQPPPRTVPTADAHWRQPETSRLRRVTTAGPPHDQYGLRSARQGDRKPRNIAGTRSPLTSSGIIPFEPWWALTIIFIDLWVIHALFVHRRLRD
jgi:hypothetical protein